MATPSYPARQRRMKESPLSSYFSLLFEAKNGTTPYDACKSNRKYSMSFALIQDNARSPAQPLTVQVYNEKKAAALLDSLPESACPPNLRRWESAPAPSTTMGGISPIQRSSSPDCVDVVDMDEEPVSPASCRWESTPSTAVHTPPSLPCPSSCGGVSGMLSTSHHNHNHPSSEAQQEQLLQKLLLPSASTLSSNSNTTKLVRRNTPSSSNHRILRKPERTTSQDHDEQTSAVIKRLVAQHQQQNRLAESTTTVSKGGNGTPPPPPLAATTSAGSASPRIPLRRSSLTKSDAVTFRQACEPARGNRKLSQPSDNNEAQHSSNNGAPREQHLEGQRGTPPAA